jgi:hypothetical protein
MQQAAFCPYKRSWQGRRHRTGKEQEKMQRNRRKRSFGGGCVNKKCRMAAAEIWKKGGCRFRYFSGTEKRSSGGMTISSEERFCSFQFCI